MRFPKKHKLNLALSNDDHKPTLKNAHFDGEVLVATNGYILVAVKPKDTAGDSPGNIPGAAIKAALAKKNKMDKVDAVLHVNDKVTIPYREKGCPETAYHYDLDNNPFPDWERVIPENPKNTLEVGLNAAFLKNLADAMGNGAVKLILDLDRLTDAGKGRKTYEMPIRVSINCDDTNTDDVIGVIMPLRIQG